MSERLSIGRVKRDLSEVINRVAFGGERIVLTSRGKPKAALVSLDDFARLEESGGADRRRRWEEWEARTRANVEAMRGRRGGEPVQVDDALSASRRDLEARVVRLGGD
jgi:prevent-host-death family protein